MAKLNLFDWWKFGRKIISQNHRQKLIHRHHQIHIDKIQRCWYMVHRLDRVQGSIHSCPNTYLPSIHNHLDKYMNMSLDDLCTILLFWLFVVLRTVRFVPALINLSKSFLWQLFDSFQYHKDHGDTKNNFEKFGIRIWRTARKESDPRIPDTDLTISIYLVIEFARLVVILIKFVAKAFRISTCS